MTGWSVSTHVYRSRSNVDYAGRKVTVRELCGLSHVAATAQPQYAGAGVMVARDHELIVAPSAVPRRDALTALLADLRASRPQGGTPAP